MSHAAPDSPHDPDDPDEQRAAIDAAAAEWMLRQDRGLTAAEQDELSRWLAADARHGAALAESRWGWEELDRLAGIQSSVHAVPDPDLLAPARQAAAGAAMEKTAGVTTAGRSPLARVVAVSFGVLAAAAAVALGAFLWQSQQLERGPALAFSQMAQVAPCEQSTLEDGTVVQLNRGAKLLVQFTAGERRVRLERGEAHFTVAKNPERPFVVLAGGVEARAVGTAFNVRLDSAALEVVVTEGRVQVQRGLGSGAGAGAGAVSPPLLERGQSARVALDVASSRILTPTVETLSAQELETRLAWQPRMLDFDNQPMAAIVAAFNRHNPVKLKIADAALAELRLSAAFRSDNVAGFVRLMESEFGMRAEWRGDSAITLSRAR